MMNFLRKPAKFDGAGLVYGILFSIPLWIIIFSFYIFIEQIL